MCVLLLRRRRHTSCALVTGVQRCALPISDPRLARLDIPLLMLVADADKLVDPRVARRVAARLPDCTIMGFGAESAHEILREADPVRDRAIAAIDAFLDHRAPA